MATKTLISLEEYEALPETENGVEYELSNGELIVLASPMLFHNRIRDDILVRFQLSFGSIRTWAKLLQKRTSGWRPIPCAGQT